MYFSTKPMANKNDRIVAYDKGPLTIQPHDPSIAWSCKVVT